MSTRKLPNIFQKVTSLEKALKTKPESYWIKRGEKMALRLFHDMAVRVPAYKRFLKKHSIRHTSVKTIDDFKKIPTINKDDYLKKNELPDLCWDGKLSEGQWIYSTTSGSTGQPYYFPRQHLQNQQYAILAELYLRNNFQIQNKTTLYIIGFPMGEWIGGVFTLQALDIIANKGNYSMAVITPGINKKQIIQAIKSVGRYYEQIIIGSYGPFLKDILDDAESEGLVWHKYNLGFIFSAEGFTEEFRTYVLNKVGVNGSRYSHTLNHYGTADMGTMAYETPFAILTRREAVKNSAVYNAIFGDDIKLPTLTQYIPELFFFEEVNDGLICSSNSGIPLVRYDLKDHGGVINFESLISTYEQEGVHLRACANSDATNSTIWRLPFVYVYERSDFSVSFYAFNIYPATIRKALQKTEFNDKLSGKFTMMVKFDDMQNQILEINIEMRPNIKDNRSLKTAVRHAVVNQLLKEYSEYQETYQEKGKVVWPKIMLRKYEHEPYFKAGVKQKWIK